MNAVADKIREMAREERQEEEKEPEVPGMLSMSDDDIANVSLEDFAAQKQKEEEEKEPIKEEETTEEEDDKEEVKEDDDTEEVEEEDTVASSGSEDIYTGQGDQSSEEAEDEEEEKETKTETSGIINYKEEYEKIFEPLKVNKREVRIKSVEDARRLMQMGVDYTKKMQALKPHLKMMRALDTNKLLDEGTINLLIEVAKGKPEAIARLLKDKEIDPLNLPSEEAEDYQPKSYTPTDEQQNLEEVLDSIRDTPSFDKTLDELGNKWDDASKQVLMEHPQLIAKINEHIATGIYDQIMSVVESERLLGRLQGLNDLAAYKAIGDDLQAKGAFTHLAKTDTKRQTASDLKQKEQVKARKRAAAPPRRSKTTPQGNKINPLSMPDDEFEKITQVRYA